MPVPVFIGDEVSAAGYRLAGLEVRVPHDDELRATLRQACDEAPLVLISAALAERLPAAERDACLAGIAPPVVVVPDLRAGTAVPDLATRLRAQLGMLE
jgi:vacuolar-type H+-ATPase subunit F/Vma7